jgi:hypothetical protein
MTFSWAPVTLEDFARFQRHMGITIAVVNGTYWTEVRPFFYRPMVIWKIFEENITVTPSLASIGGVQYSVAKADAANSYLNWFSYDHIHAYSAESLAKNPRRQLRIGQSNFEVRQIVDSSTFIREAWPVYRAFHERTHYRTGSHRRNPVAFAAWAESLFRIPGVLALGGYHQGQLGGVGLSLLLDDTVYYASVFCDDRALKLSLYDVLWHTLRESAATQQNIQQLFMGTYTGNPGLDRFKILRGAKLVRQPARLQLNPIAKFALRQFMTAQYSRLLGHIEGDPFHNDTP